MQPLVNALAVLSFVSVVILLFGMAALLTTVRGLQQTVLAGSPARTPPRSLPELSSGGAGTLALIVSAGCPACYERATYLSTLSNSAPGNVRLTLVTTDAACAEWAGPGVEAVVDAALVGRIAPTATPIVIHVDAAGNERFRRLVGSDEELASALSEISQTATEITGTAPPNLSDGASGRPIATMTRQGELDD